MYYFSNKCKTYYC